MFLYRKITVEEDIEKLLKNVLEELSEPTAKKEFIKTNSVIMNCF